MNQYQKVAVHGLIKREDGKFLVTKRSPINDFLPNVYDFPGGTVEFGEKCEEALIREIKEETSLEVEILKPVFVTTIVQRNERHQFWIIYECKYISGEVKLNPEEHSEYKWVDKEEAKKLDNIIFLDQFLKS